MRDVTESSLVTAMIGDPLQTSRTIRSFSPVATVAASLEHARIRDRRTGRILDLSLQIAPGEIVGVAALDGAATTLLRMLARRVKPLSGIVNLPSRIGFVPEDRRGEAMIEDFSLAENFALAGAGAATGLMDWRSIGARTQDVITRFDVRTPGVEASPAELSGGNQQRFVLGRELEGVPDLLVLENPTQGLDVNASAFVHAQIRNAANAGAAVVFYSSDLDELAALSSRVIVMSDAGVTDVNADRDAIGRALLGAELPDER
jgi:simple sugar transport system ATP-binding protein